MGIGVVSTERDVEQCVCAVRPAAAAQSAKQQVDYSVPRYNGPGSLTLCRESLASGICTELRQNTICLDVCYGLVLQCKTPLCSTVGCLLMDKAFPAHLAL